MSKPSQKRVTATANKFDDVAAQVSGAHAAEFIAEVPAPTVSAITNFDPSKYTTKIINLRARAMKNGEQLIIRADGEVEVGKPLKTDGKSPKKDVELVNVTNVQTGEQFRLIAGSVLAGILRTECGGAITGRLFAIERFEPKNGKLYATYNVRELVEA